MKQNKQLLAMLRITAAASALALVFGPALAQGPIQGVPGTPRVDQPSQGGGGGVGIGINIDLGSVFNAIRNATRKDAQDKDDQTKPPVLQKKAVTVSSGASGSYTIDWVVQYANNTGATLPNALIKDGPIATIIPGSLQPPPAGWTATTNANVPIDNFALWTGINITPHGVMTATFPPPAAASTWLGDPSSGDGYHPIPYTKISAPSGPRIYIMNHHKNPGRLKCVDLTTQASCAGWGTLASGKPLPAGDGSANSSSTKTNTSEYVIDNGKFYYASQGPAGFGIGCFNLETETECGFIKFGPRPPGLHINGPWRIGNEFYVAATNGAVYCADLSAGVAKCVGNSFEIPTSTIKTNVQSQSADDWSYGGSLAGKVVGTKLYITAMKSGKKYTNCFDSVTKSACWSYTAPTRGTSPYIFVTSDQHNGSNYLHYDTSGNAVAICTMSFAPTGQFCVDTATGLQKFGLPAVLPGLGLGAGLETHVAGKTYFVNGGPMQNDLRSDAAWCWNWISNSACTSGPLGQIAPSRVGNYNYGSNVDDQGCVWVLGHTNVLWSFDPNNIDTQTGLAKPCGPSSGKFNKVFQPLQYCSGPKPFRWTSVEVKGAPLANYDKFIVKVLDSSNNTVLFTKDLKAANQLLTSITGIDAQTLSKPLKIEVEYTPKPGMGASDKPYLEVRYNAPPIEFCFKSKHTCEQSKITNTVETPDPVKQGSYITVKVDVDKPQNCTVNPPPPPPPPPPSCGTATTPACCGQPGQPACPSPICGQPGQPRCPDLVCIPGTPGCPVINFGCRIGDPLCNPRPPPPSAVCLTGDCAPKAGQSTGQEFKEAKVACVRKVKPVDKPADDAPKKIAPKPKPQTVAAPAPVVSGDAAVKPKPKPRPKPAQAKPATLDDDC